LFNQKETTTIVIANEVKQSQDCRNLKIAAISKLPQSLDCPNLLLCQGGFETPQNHSKKHRINYLNAFTPLLSKFTEVELCTAQGC
jgi:hypothetical protein